MRARKLISVVTLACGHEVETEIKHNVIRAWCTECEDNVHIENFGLFRAKCTQCRYGAMETDQGVIGRRAGYHANKKGHTVNVLSPQADVSFVIEPDTVML